MRSKMLFALLIILAVFGASLWINYQAFIVKNPKLAPKLGLDLKGGVRVILEAVDTPEVKATNENINGAVSVIDKRVNALGLSESVVVREGPTSKRIIVELPGWEDPEKAKELIGKTALLEFKTEDNRTILTGKDLKDVKLVFSQNPENLGAPEIGFELNTEGAKIFAKETEASIGKTIAIYLDDKLLMKPTVQSAITDGKGVITGKFTTEEAQNYVTLLKSGSLPVKVEIIGEEVVGPTLGKESIDKSLKAGIIAFALVLLFMILFYRFLGVVSSMALIIYASVVMTVLILLKATLSLPAIGGLVLSIGMAVDANVIIFERIREELIAKKSVRSSIAAGFAKAFRTVFDSNLTVLVGTFILFYLGTGVIKGFSITLSSGVLTGMFTAVFVSHTLVDLMFTPFIASKKWLIS